MREHHRPLTANEAHFAHHAADTGAHADDRAFIAVDRGDALRQNFHMEAFAAQLDAAGERAAVEQPAPQARIVANGERPPPGIDIGRFHAWEMFFVVIITYPEQFTAIRITPRANENLVLAVPRW
jgi:hypothetical protein